MKFRYYIKNFILYRTCFGEKLEPVKKITIRNEKYEDGYSDLYAKISENGEIVIDGCHAGKLAEEMFGDWDYEYWLSALNLVTTLTPAVDYLTDPDFAIVAYGYDG